MNKKRTSTRTDASIINMVKDVEVHFNQSEEDKEKKITVSIIINLKSGEYMSYIGRISNPHIKEILGKVFSFYSNIIKIYFRDHDDHPLWDQIEQIKISS